MEISLDLDFIRAALAEEYQRARGEIHGLGPLRALENSQRRHDLRIASAPDVGTLACRAGCTWCCYFSVDVRAAEVFLILDFVERTFTAEDKARLFAAVRMNAEKLRDLGESDRMKRNIRCPFLKEERCSIYPVRPQTCRNYHATDVTGCRKSYEDPENMDIDPDFAPWVYQAGTAHVDAFSTALRDAGFDTRAYELNCALHAASSEPGSRQRFECGQAPFTRLNGENVPVEFDDLDP